MDDQSTNTPPAAGGKLERLVELAAECDDLIGRIEARITCAKELGVPEAAKLADEEQEHVERVRGPRAEIEQMIVAEGQAADGALRGQR